MISKKIVMARIHDVVMAGLAVLLALVARYGVDELPSPELLALWLGVTVVTAAIVFHVFGLGRGIWRFASITDLRLIVTASAVTLFTFVVVVFAINRLEALPRTTPVIAWFAMVVLLGAPRLAYRALKDGGLAHLRPRDFAKDDVSHVLIIGDATDADKIVRIYGLENSRRYKAHGIIDYNGRRTGSNLRGIPFLGGLAQFDEVVARLSRSGITIDAAILAGRSDRAEDLSTLSAAIAKWQFPLRRISPAPLTGGEPDLEGVRLEDLLGRPSVKLENESVRSLVAGRTIVVTGAGGSIGSEIVHQIAMLGPARVVMIDQSEYSLYRIDQQMASGHPHLARRGVIADIREPQRIRQLFEDERPSLVFHAAALKHVPMVEANVSEGVLTNVIGTRNVADAAVAANVDAMVLVSTDKTIRPTSVMGASKRVAEAYCQSLDVSGVRTRFITVRFGNVLGSRGSVVPLFKRQIQAGGPVTVTHPDMRRYFMTIGEATALVLQAAAAGIHLPNQRGHIFVLDMGEPVRILDLAKTMIVLAGLRPDEDIRIEFTGVRPGEKLFEELFDRDELPTLAGVDGVFVAPARELELERVSANIDDLARVAREGNEAGARALLSNIVGASSPLPVDANGDGPEVADLPDTGEPHAARDGSVIELAARRGAHAGDRKGS